MSPLAFARGFRYFLTGWRWLRRERPDLMPLVLWPTGLSLVLLVAVVVGTFSRFGQLRQALLPARPLYNQLLSPLLAIAVLLASGLVFLIAQAAIAAPFKELLSARVEAHVTGRPPRQNTLGEMLAGIGHELLKLVIFGGGMAALYLGGWLIPVIGPVLIVAGTPLFSAYFLAFDHADHGLGRLGQSFAEKWRFFSERRSLTLGFGTALALWLLIPVVGAVTLPAAVVGGTLLFLDESGARPAVTPPEAATGDPAATGGPLPGGEGSG